MSRPGSAIRTLSEEAYAALRRDIVRGSLAPGIKLRLAWLQKEYGFGALPLREALNRLSAEAMVEKHHQRGFFVPPLDLRACLDITNARLVVEDTAVRLSIARADRAWEERLVLAFHYLSRVAPEEGHDAVAPAFLLTEEWAETHRIFHLTLVDNCGNDWLVGFARTLYDQSARYRHRRRQLSAVSPPLRANLVREHRDILEAALRGDADTAVGRLIAHYQCSTEILLGQRVELVRAPLRFVLPDEGTADAGLCRPTTAADDGGPRPAARDGGPSDGGPVTVSQ
jgi:GntR family transcriptional regulator, carbon starvation induced regulator